MSSITLQNLSGENDEPIRRLSLMKVSISHSGCTKISSEKNEPSMRTPIPPDTILMKSFLSFVMNIILTFVKICTNLGFKFKKYLGYCTPKLTATTNLFKKKKMIVIQDTLWQQCLNDAVKLHRLNTPNDKCYKLANATWKVKMAYKAAEARKNEHTIVFLSKPPEEVRIENNRTNQCTAQTMSGKRCSFRAVCGCYCKKHNVKFSGIGKKVDVSNFNINV